MSAQGFTRRRVLRLIAAGAAAWRVPVAVADVPVTRWRGWAFGADASLTIRDPDRARAERALADCVVEIDRLERVFSLHRRDSALVALNGAGALVDPPTELVDVLTFAARVSEVSGDAFDVTVQPLWGVYVRAQRNGWSRPDDFEAALDQARARIGWRRLAIARDRLAFTSSGMAATLNGIAQGYATDRIAERLRSHGFPHVLVDVGEFRGLGERDAGQPWRVGVAWPDRAGLATVLTLSDRAVATSSPLATPFDSNGKNHHLFDPHSGRSAHGWTSVSVTAPTAVLADALSTAIDVAPEAAAKTILVKGGGEEAILVDRRGRLVRLRA
jgi:thiamine biosynthesis lipoprotein